MNIFKLLLSILFTFVFGFFGTRITNAEVISKEAPYIEVSNDVSIQENKNTDVYVIGDNINVEREIVGDFFAIGKKITINSPIKGTAHLVAEQITVNAPISGSLLYLADNVYISSLGEIEKDAYGFTNKLVLDGRIGQSLNLNSKSTSTISGKIIGDLYYSGSKPEILENSFINGQVIETMKNQNIESSNRFDLIISKILHSLTIILVGFILFRINKDKLSEIVVSYKTGFARNILIGIVSLILIPVIVIALLVSIIGFPIGLFITFLAIFAGYFGYVIPALALGQKVFEKRPLGILQLITGVLLLDILTVTPIIGSTLSIIIVVSSIGLVVNKFVLKPKSEKRKK
ncbi:MAG: hypothetical protein A3F31_01355 [Candidatus Levybacteria bacterium RIFCSPHIGHO2_12_FULL_38_12]|nr:MAG: hypothetical protein A3F31_01355 [Candidatus Levybacteria bacterium RIFCSPHIGHO2_12_FULL_38_12]